MFKQFKSFARALRIPSIDERETAYLNGSIDRIDLEYRQRDHDMQTEKGREGGEDADGDAERDRVGRRADAQDTLAHIAPGTAKTLARPEKFPKAGAEGCRLAASEQHGQTVAKR